MNWPAFTSYPAVIETGGTPNHWDVELVQEIGRRATGEPRGLGISASQIRDFPYFWVTSFSSFLEVLQ